MLLPSAPKLGFLEPHLRQSDPSLLSMFSLLRGQRWGSCERGLPPCHAGPGAGSGGRNGHEEPVLIFLPGELGCGSGGRWPFFCPPGPGSWSPAALLLGKVSRGLWFQKPNSLNVLHGCWVLGMTLQPAWASGRVLNPKLQPLHGRVTLPL